MEELDEYLWETLYIVKSLYDHEKSRELLDAIKSDPLDSDDFYRLATETMGYVFADTREYYNEDQELEIWVFFDPMFQEFYSLCDRYERECSLPPEKNQYRLDMQHTLQYSLTFGNYDYGYRIYDDPNKKCRIVLLLGCEFMCHYEVVPGLLDIAEAYQIQIGRLKEALGLCEKSDSGEKQDGKDIDREQEEWKEAA